MHSSCAEPEQERLRAVVVLRPIGSPLTVGLAIGLLHLSRGGVQVASIAGLTVSGLVLYALPAFELEGQRRRAILPTLRRGHGKTGMLGDAGAQLSGVAREAGDRETS